MSSLPEQPLEPIVHPGWIPLAVLSALVLGCGLFATLLGDVSMFPVGFLLLPMQIGLLFGNAPIVAVFWLAAIVTAGFLLSRRTLATVIGGGVLLAVSVAAPLVLTWHLVPW
jgi:hypothetical protein